MLSIKDAIARAKEHATEVFAGENISDLQLEEIELSGSAQPQWLVTLSFLRVQAKEGSGGALASVLLTMRSSRIFKVVHLNAETGELIRIAHKSSVMAA
jgi:hypothetical protein